MPTGPPGPLTTMSFSIPQCKNPNHPAGSPRDKMVVTDENEFGVMLACVPCRDINRIISSQYVTLPKGWQRANHFAQVQKLDRDRSLMKKLKRIGFSMPT